ncbi:MAG: hypothetical protein Kow0010_03000 [Dehalococcoidia bacterium]
MDQAAITQTRVYGAIISLFAVIGGVVYAVGVLKRSYWALALPVTAATLGALYITLWIGRALIATPTNATDA